ncbi:MAG TPA: class I SAM-dependent methyltransferase [Actinomycetota bacterium]|nr:class I SAM-dependent methyltransferase [Actinomycetota bacterium]
MTPTKPDPRARAFDRVVDAYERGRPGYPPEAVDRLTTALDIGPRSTILDLGAGTGKLTKLLIGSGATVLAAEPLPNMRMQLASSVPDAVALAAKAEALPLRPKTVNAVMVAEAFHWFSFPEAVREIHHVLKPGGGLGLLWNWPAESGQKWTGQIRHVLDSYGKDARNFHTTPWRATLEQSGDFTRVSEATIPWLFESTSDTLLARIESISFIAELPSRERVEVLEEIEQILQNDPETKDGAVISSPYNTHLFWCFTK